MNAFFALVRKDLILYVSDRRALLMHLVLPIVIAAFFGSVFGGSAKSGAIDVALVQQDASEVGRRIGAGLQADSNLHVTVMDRAQAEQAVRKGSQAVAVVLPPGFAEAAGSAMFTPGPKPVIELLYDPSQTAVLGMVKGMLTQQVMSVVSAEMFGGPMGRKLTERSLQQLDAGTIADPALRDMLAAVRTFQAQPQQAGGSGAPRGLSMPFTTRDQGLSNAPALQGYNPYAHAFSGMGVQFILFMGMNMGIAMLAARRDGIWNRLLAAPVSLALVVLARAVSATIIAFCLLCIVFAVAVLAFGVTVSSIPGFLGIALCFGALTAGFGLLVAAFGKTPEAARGIAMFATLIMVMLGGAWVPTFVFPAWVQQATMIVPTRWAITGLDAVTWRGLGLPEAMPAMAALLGFAALFMALAIWRFQKART
ncbi:ABC transporter permease [Herbaspirillum sp. SJZ107]|uniref:ABC transporter permease n=1 Tax=Herbaspirillum sp. SJZ107 TaxID=2572881 RepID=UPI00114F547E|nr:ABC transporter permease [Herbaspirillum sp. SJZ107]TQK02862.1 ABC-2 type transport system permease protein [Herbaspirillum sp. SJZ107]